MEGFFFHLLQRMIVILYPKKIKHNVDKIEFWISMMP